MEQTLAMIKPEAFGNNGLVLDIIDIIEEKGFNIKEMIYKKLTVEEVEKFYECHKGKPFFNDYVQHMASGKIVALRLEKENAVKEWRELMGNTDPKLAKEGTIRKKFAKSISRNIVHGSDSLENAKKELSFFFSK